MNGLTGVVEVIEFLPRDAALKEMHRAHVLLLLASEQKLQVPGKAYEYLAAGGNILALAEEDSATAALVKHVQCGEIVHHTDSIGIKRAIKKWFRQYKSLQRGAAVCSSRADGVLGEYEWSALGERYVSLLSECVEREPLR